MMSSRSQPHDDLGSFGLSTSGLSRDDDARVLPGSLHRLVGGLGDGEDVRRTFENLTALKNKSGLEIWPQPLSREDHYAR